MSPSTCSCVQALSKPSPSAGHERPERGGIEGPAGDVLWDGDGEADARPVVHGSSLLTGRRATPDHRSPH